MHYSVSTSKKSWPLLRSTAKFTLTDIKMKLVLHGQNQKKTTALSLFTHS